MPSAIVWFRRDLRLSDNPALTAAVRTVGRDGEIVALFCIDPLLWDRAGDNRRAFLVGCLDSLDASIGGHLVVRWGDPNDVVPGLAVEVGAGEVMVARDFGPYGKERDTAVRSSLQLAGRALIEVGSPYAVEPGAVLNQSGAPYKVFTPYARAWVAHGWAEPIRAPANVRWAAGIPRDGIPAIPVTRARLPQPGEAAAKKVLRRFHATHLRDYDEQRDDPGADATSRLSPYLKWGCIHPRQLLARLGSTQGERTFRNELCWRELYADVLHHRPETSRSAFNPAMRAMRVDQRGTAARFDAWCKGQTGFPIVDAGMRQLLAEGWMHNRVRMLTASFLVKDLHLDWARGARWFMQHLVDGDLASNQHGWQWVAGTGTDAAPYFRVFNPVTQGERFDPQGTYVRRWLPELTGVPDKHVHHPWTDPAGPAPGYPPPLVDHAEEREEALRRYTEVRQRRGA